MKKTSARRPFSSWLLLACVLSAAFLQAGCARAGGEAPAKEVIEKVMKGTWDKAASSLNPKSVLTLDSVKFGQAYTATAQEVQVEGFPEKTTVTPAIVEFTVRTYYTGETQALHRSREARVYKDKFGEWAVMTGAVKGQDSTKIEPAQK